MKRSQKGSGIYLLIVFVVILLGYVMVGGVVPGFNLTPSDNSNGWEMITPNPQGGKSSLQLDPIRFKKCSSTVAIDFVVDDSGSMDYGNKMTELKKGLISFTDQLDDRSVIGIDFFNYTYSNKLSLSYYKDVKQQLSAIINSMQPNGATYTKDAFSKVQEKLNSSISKFPGYNFVIIFISDGIPETNESDSSPYPACLSSDLCSQMPTSPNRCRCFAPEQDPTDIANQIKQQGIRIFTVSYVDVADQKFNTRLQTLMKNTASSAEDYYPALDANKVSDILKQIAVRLCSEPQ